VTWVVRNGSLLRKLLCSVLALRPVASISHLTYVNFWDRFTAVI
jgi:hypothetical protein